MKKFNRNSIKIIRTTKNMTLEAFAETLSNGDNKVSRQNVWQWENGEQVPSVPSLLKIVNAHNVPFDIFFERDDYHEDIQEA
ncbi:MAG: helix-turn-helix transcriptional regulator [Candidatus Omnitrophota bacterium]|jgi:DNA-binding transcriptional regulator YiaG